MFNCTVVRLLAAGCVSTLFVGLVQFFLLAESCPDKSPCLLVKLHDPYEWMRIYLIGVSTMCLLGGILILLCLGDDVKHALLWLTGGRANEVGRWGRRGRRRIPRGRDGPIGGVGINGVLNAAHAAGANQVPLHPIVNAPDPVAAAAGAGAGANGRPVIRPAVDVPVTELTRRMKTMQAALQDFITEAATGQWNSDQIGRLDTLWDTLVWPLFRDLVLYTTLLNIGMYAGKCLAESLTSISSSSSLTFFSIYFSMP